MNIWTALFLLSHVLLTSSRFHASSLWKKGFIQNLINDFRCDFHDVIVRNLIYYLNGIKESYITEYLSK
jgi:hypothetical protein